MTPDHPDHPDRSDHPDHADHADRADRPGPPPDAVAQRRPLLRVSHLSKTFIGTKALDDVSLEVAAGEVVAIVGQNGSG